MEWLISIIIRLKTMGLLDYIFSALFGIITVSIIGFMYFIYPKEIKRLYEEIDKLKEENNGRHQDIWDNIDKALDKGEDRKVEIIDYMKERFTDIKDTVEKNEGKLDGINVDVIKLNSKLIKYETIRDYAKNVN